MSLFLQGTLVVFLLIGAFKGSNGECKDLNQYCRLLQIHGYCNTYPDWMKKNCPESCNFCSRTDSGSFERDALNAHNKYRRIHNAPDMTLNSEMSRQAAAYAAELARRGGNLIHSSTSDGENLIKACGQLAHMTGAAATKLWYDEVCFFDFNNGGFSSHTGHFTQLVWKGSTKLGIGKATNGWCTYIVARYRRAGNYRGQYRQNVLKGSFDKRRTCNLGKREIHVV